MRGEKREEFEREEVIEIGFGDVFVDYFSLKKILPRLYMVSDVGANDEFSAVELLKVATGGFKLGLSGTAFSRNIGVLNYLT